MHTSIRRAAKLVAALALTATGCAAPSAAPAPGVAIEVAAGVYMIPGSGGEPDADNLGRVGNAGFIVGDSAVVAIDTGTSYAHGTELLAAIRRVTDKPVRLALITHTRQEFLFGAAAYRERGITVAMHAKAATLMTSRCEGCLKTLRRVLGDEALRGTVMFKPDQTFEAGHRIDTLTERPLQVLYFDHSSGPGDIAVLDARSGVLFAGGLIDQGRIPDVADSNLPGWRRALQALRKLAPKTVVPGHGRAGTERSIDDEERYLVQLEARVRALMKADTPLSQIADAASLPDFKSWDQYETTHRRNASIVFLRIEREQLFNAGE